MDDPFLDLTEFCIVDGPLDLKEPAFSFAENYDEVYTPEEIARAILAVPGVRLLRPADPGWYDWSARWEEGGRYIVVEQILVCPIDPDFRPAVTTAWGGSRLRIHCQLTDLLGFWKQIRLALPRVWLHDPRDCRLYSRESFAQEYSCPRPCD